MVLRDGDEPAESMATKGPQLFGRCFKRVATRRVSVENRVGSMSAIATIRQGILLWLLVTCALPCVCFQKPRVLPLRFEHGGVVPGAKRDSAALEPRDAETTYRVARIRRSRRAERLSEIAKAPCNRYAWQGSDCSVKPTGLQLCRAVGSTNPCGAAASPPVVPLRC